MKLDNRRNLTTKPIFFSNGSNKPLEWNEGEYIDLNAPKAKFITKFKNRVKNFGKDLYKFFKESK